MNTWNMTPGGKVRARGAGIPFQGVPGKNNSITDVEGVQVGYSTLVEGESVRTGVTAVLPEMPRLNGWLNVWAGWVSGHCP